MRGEELILRFFAFQITGVDNYKTPQKIWLNKVAENGREYSAERISELKRLWESTIEKCLIIFEPNEYFRRLPLTNKTAVINRALMDLTMYSLSRVNEEEVMKIKDEFRNRYIRILTNEGFLDLITRAIDHRSRTLSRFDAWENQVMNGLIK